MYLIIVASSLISLLGLMKFAGQAGNGALVMIFALAPVTIALAVMIYIALHPKGPEKDFELPGIEIDPEDASTVKGTIKLNAFDKREVEVLVPNVYGGGTSLLNTATIASDFSGGTISTPEMVDMALEYLQIKYPNCHWVTYPEIIIKEDKRIVANR